MRKPILLLASLALAMLFSCSSNRSHHPAVQQSTTQLHHPAVQQSTTQPNIVFILADDMRYDDLKYMPKTRSLVQEKGMSFQSAFVSNALCCPARATIMRGQYSHNNGVWTNGGSGGGWQVYQSDGDEQDNVATRLDAAGYRTALFGKYLNGYANTTEIPPGWNRWFAHVNNGIDYYDYQINDDGSIVHYGSTSADYETDVIADHAETFIGSSVNMGVPFFAYVTPHAPHFPDIPALRDEHTYDGLKAARRLPSFNEADVSDKPPWIRDLPRLGDHEKADIDNRHERRAETLQALDDLVAGVVGKLRDKGVLTNTYIFFTSDNGWHEGEHRIEDHKSRPYDEDIHMPLLVRGPGVAAGSTTDKLALNTDYLPTFTDLAGTQTPSYVDGRSLRSVLRGKATAWRSAILLEAARNTDYAPYSPGYHGIRTSSEKYIEYADGTRELYELNADPYELNNSYEAATPPDVLAARLQALKNCAGDSCQAAENGQ
jgi:N-acetylglucosamine-6-sulfatase